MSVLGIDIGNDNSVVAAINKGAINIVRNDVSERLTPTMVAFTEKERLIGDNALAKVKSNFRNTCRNIKNLIGKLAEQADQDDIELSESFGNIVPCEHNYLGYQVEYKKEKVDISVVRLAEKYIGKECNEIVLSYPPTFTNSQKECLIAATKIINVNALRIISDNTAVALDYGMYRMKEFKNDVGSVVVFVNIGYANTCVCVARFFSNKCEILSDVADTNLGGRNIDNELIKYINNVFVNSHKMNPLYKVRSTDLCEMGTGKLNPYFVTSNNETSQIDNKIRVKLQDVAVKTKKILSANNETSIHVECLYEDLDCQGFISRDNFEELCAPFFLSKLKSLLNKAMQVSKLNIADVQSIEILGGSTRIPFIQKFLQQYFDKPLSKTLIADESVARGCVLSGAMISKHYKVKEYECIERVTHPISVEWHNVNDPSKSKVERLYDTDSLKKKVKKVVIPEKGHIKVTAYYEDSPDLPPHCIKELGSCLIKVNEKNDKLVESHVMTTFSESDTFTFLGAQTVSKTVIKSKEDKKKSEEKKDIQKGDAAGGGAGSADASNEGDTDGKDNKTNEDESNKGKENNNEGTTMNGTATPSHQSGNKAELKKGEEGKVQTCYTTLPIEIIGAPGSYSTKDIYNFSEAEINMQHSDMQEAERLKNINELETIIYETRNRLNEMYKDFVMEDERDSILLALDDCENWIYDNIDENKNAFIKKKEQIRDRVKDIIYKYDTYTAKEKNLGNILNHLQNIIAQCDKRPSEESQKIIARTTKLLDHLNAMQEKEMKQALYEAPLYTLKDIENEFNEVTQMAQKHFSKLEAEELAKQKEKEKQEKQEREKMEKEKKKQQQADRKDADDSVEKDNNKDAKETDETDNSTNKDNAGSAEEKDI
ncbi:cloroquine resistance associated protein Cg4 [Plasmodium cynomolgi strain B]|uniref:Cloroquine resistance associated protein Cg4 n=1 Tax=Plasmodium cynomolgi (strain B) TaxID=1120755 RepID=K6UC88_PLACD|nr:cloroquine resistance associated protein Cg4 [Plasmodium cynomolgi strain B]GAB64426.1 cloroquine resistance associated protein Cg4 [Plasmodium cynomolgi strain B]